MTSRIHKVEQHRLAFPGIEAMTLASNHHFPRHSHDRFGVGVIACGAHRSWSSIGRVEASAGDVIMVNPGEMHDGAPLDSAARVWRMIYLSPAVIAGAMEHEISGAVEIIHPVARDHRLASRFARLFDCLTSPASDLLAKQENLLHTLLCILKQHATAQLSSGGPAPAVARALQRLDSSPETPASLAELAALSDVSRFQLLRGFRREVGVTPHAYLVQKRVRLVQQLLSDGRTPVQAALQAGFADQSHMTRAFVRQLGITPSRYRAAVS